MKFYLALLFTILPLFSEAEFRAGAAITDITPKQLPVLVNGGMLSRSVDKINTPLNARSLAMSDGNETVVIVVVDSCMVPRPLCDNAKKIASEKSGIPSDHILISATHTHTAPSCMGCLGTDPDPVYSLFLTKRLTDAILAPLKNLEPARAGFGRIDAGDHTALRRWVRRPDRIDPDPFGNPTVRANMHAANKPENVIGKSGPRRSGPYPDRSSIRQWTPHWIARELLDALFWRPGSQRRLFRALLQRPSGQDQTGTGESPAFRGHPLPRLQRRHLAAGL